MFTPLHEAVGITTVSAVAPTSDAVESEYGKSEYGESEYGASEAGATEYVASGGTASDGAASVLPAAARPVLAQELAEPPVNLELRRLAAELAPMVDVWRRLLLQHLPDTAGRCRTCTKGGTGLPTTRWPCSIHGIAELARRCHDVQQHDPKSA